MSRRSISRRSISKQRGLEMSSRLMPPKDGASRTIVSTISSTSVVSSAIGIASTPPNCLNKTALPSMTGIDAAGPMSPRPSTARAVGHDGDGVGDPRVVVGDLGIGGDGLADPGHARRVGHREVVGVAEGNRGRDLHLAAAVQREDGIVGIGGVGVHVDVSGNHGWLSSRGGSGGGSTGPIRSPVRRLTAARATAAGGRGGLCPSLSLSHDRPSPDGPRPAPGDRRREQAAQHHDGRQPRSAARATGVAAEVRTPASSWISCANTSGLRAHGVAPEHERVTAKSRPSAVAEPGATATPMPKPTRSGRHVGAGRGLPGRRRRSASSSTTTRRRMSGEQFRPSPDGRRSEVTATA